MTRESLLITAHLILSFIIPVVLFCVLPVKLRIDRVLFVGIAEQLWLLPETCVLFYGLRRPGVIRAVARACAWPLFLGVLLGGLSLFAPLSGDGAVAIIALWAAIAIASLLTCAYGVAASLITVAGDKATAE